MLDMMILVYGGIFLAVLLAVEGVYMAFGGGAARKAVNRRLRLRASGKSSEEVMETLRRDTPGQAAQGGPLGWLGRLAARSGVAASPVRLVMMMALMAVVVGMMLMALAGAGLMIALPVGAAAGVGVVVAVLNLQARRRLKRFNMQLPDAVDMVVRSLRAGHPTTAAMKLVSEQMSDPIGSEFGLVVDEMTYGLDLREALDGMVRRVPSDELSFMVTAIRLQSTAGGNLTEVLGSLARVIRERARFGLKVKALSAQSRFSAWCITAAPFAVFGLVNVLSPDYFAEVSSDPMFMPGFMIAGVLMALGVVTIFRMVNFRY
ncbi:type II secretion system F family protein [Caenispirillum salinarum]|uniref:type II secretion system F family protein n=1 Tax=Caenispirillum salinarum TaxID=859058 RepID=UPI00384B2840